MSVFPKGDESCGVIPGGPSRESRFVARILQKLRGVRDLDLPMLRIDFIFPFPMRRFAGSGIRADDGLEGQSRSCSRRTAPKLQRGERRHRKGDAQSVRNHVIDIGRKGVNSIALTGEGGPADFEISRSAPLKTQQRMSRGDLDCFSMSFCGPRRVPGPSRAIGGPHVG